MKKTLTITFADNANYGAYLQAFSLQKILGENNLIANERPLLRHLVSKKRRDKFVIVWRLMALYRLFRRRRSFREVEKLRIYRPSIFSQEIDLSPFDCLVCGSDQIWNPNFIKERENVFFLNFTGKQTRVSYAASLGTQKWPKNFETMVLPFLERFDAISVREQSSVAYLTSLGLKNVECVCDPTLLHDGDFYRKEFPYKEGKKDFVFVYRLREKLPSTLNLVLGKNVDEVYLEDKQTMVSVTQWLQKIDSSKFVVTDSFHCVVFCLLFHKTFVVIPNRTKGMGMNERFVSLLGKTELEYRILTCEESNEEILQKLNTPIDWGKVDCVLEKWRLYSIEWLKSAINRNDR